MSIWWFQLAEPRPIEADPSRIEWLATDDLDPEETPEPKNDVPENQETGTPATEFPDEDDASVAHEPVTEGDR